MEKALEEVEREFEQICAGARLRGRIHFYRQDDGSAHVEFDGTQYNYVVTERGREFERRQTHDRNELLYWLISTVVSEVASEFELDNRIDGQDFRRLYFAKRIELMSAIRAEWGSRQRAELDAVLKSHPYRDVPLPLPQAPTNILKRIFIRLLQRARS